MIETRTTYRRVEHRVTIGLTEDDRFEATDQGYTNKRGDRFLASFVSWPARWTGNEESPSLDSRVTVTGYFYRKDGSLGQRRGTCDVAIRDLPLPIREHLIREAQAVWKP